MKSEGNTGLPVHGKAIENFARAPRDEKWFSSWGPGEFVFYAKNCT